MLEITDATMDAFADAAIAQTFDDVAAALEAKGADAATAELCAERAIELGIEYGISDTPSLVGIGELLGRYDAEFYRVRSVQAALTNRRIEPEERIGRIVNSPVLLKRIRENVPHGLDRRLRASSAKEG
ncbi:hypothetical protein [Erythrobacter sp. JK5]|uniref:hypothetical protein n=1 Tax=Erythrobacter sp. JK5 TaxID=2829500 RepID=UPI001BA907B6|nr:hypothetical protein [Erythrobacter sp. JK5]QUL38367.1 hypothetical protein KDC96_02830 [Erythrobacter sp. JK5]